MVIGSVNNKNIDSKKETPMKQAIRGVCIMACMSVLSGGFLCANSLDHLSIDSLCLDGISLHAERSGSYPQNGLLYRMHMSVKKAMAQLLVAWYGWRYKAEQDHSSSLTQ